MKIYAIHFRVIKTEYPEAFFAEKKDGEKVVDKIKIDKEKGLVVLHDDLMKYLEYGNGYDKIIYLGELDNKYFAPVISESEAVNNLIISKKTKSVIGMQG